MQKFWIALTHPLGPTLFRIDAQANTGWFGPQALSNWGGSMSAKPRLMYTADEAANEIKRCSMTLGDLGERKFLLIPVE